MEENSSKEAATCWSVRKWCSTLLVSYRMRAQHKAIMARENHMPRLKAAGKKIASTMTPMASQLATEMIGAKKEKSLRVTKTAVVRPPVMHKVRTPAEVR